MSGWIRTLQGGIKWVKSGGVKVKSMGLPNHSEVTKLNGALLIMSATTTNTQRQTAQNAAIIA